jgi:glucokinase
VRAVTTNLEGAMLQRAERQLSMDATRDELRASFHEVLAALGSTSRPSALGVAIPGFLDREKTVRSGVNLVEMVGMNIEAEFSLASGVHNVVVLPDLAAAALAEASASSGEGDRLLCVGLGTGANAALAVGRHVVDLADGALGDAGHVVVEPDGPTCPCGGRGCLEAVCSGIALARDGEPFGLDDGRAVIQAARAGHPRAVQLLDRAGVALGRAIASWAAMTVPDVVAVVGGLSSAGDLLLEPARRELGRVAQPRYAALHVRPSILGSEATIIGAAIAAIDAARSLMQAPQPKGDR